MFYRKEHIHFIGIGGAGMCPLAELMVRNGFSVSGSDQQVSPSSQLLESLGVSLQYHHVPDLISKANLVVYSSAIRADNPELIVAQTKGIRCIKRAEMLGDLMRAKFSIGIAGTHGKTTTTSLIGAIFKSAGADPIVLVGGTMRNSGSNAIAGNGNILVAEADEYDRSFLKMYPSVAVITNIEADHLDIYRDLDDITGAFIMYAGMVPFYGFVLLCKDDPVANSIIDSIPKKVITYGTTDGADYQALDIVLGKGTASFSVVAYSKQINRIVLPLPGMHNVRNALAACAVAHAMNISDTVIAQALALFHGVRRRFEIVGTAAGITVVDDYAHHPTEINATLDSARHADFKRVVAVFQPHLYSRTRDFLQAFAESLARADVVIVMPVYKAREEPIPGVCAEMILAAIHEKKHAHAFFCPSIAELPELIVQKAKAGDGLILMGAGDIGMTSITILKRLGNR
jgi:UDP-N-acetylmuramate--alanine ligase